MVEIYKVIAYIPLFNQIFDDKNKNGSLKGANNNQVCKGGISNLLAFFGVFLMIRKIDICDIPFRWRRESGAPIAQCTSISTLQ